MKKIYPILFFTFCYNCSFAQSPNWLWAKGMGGTGSDAGNSISTDAFDNVYTIGAFIATVDFNPGPGVFNLTSAGLTDIFISKLDNSGNFVWAKQIGGIAYDACNAIAIDASGSLYITGAFTGTVDFDPGPGIFNLSSDSAQFSDIFICKLDLAGNFIWAKAIGAPGSDAGMSIIVDLYNSGNLYTTGEFGGTADFDPGAGVFNLTSAGDIDIFILRSDSSGNFVWAKAMGGTGTDKGTSIALDSAGNNDVYATGFFSGIADFDPGAGIYNLSASGTFNTFISKLDSSGNFVWAKALTGTAITIGSSIAVDFYGSGESYITGHFSGTTDFDPGIGVFNLTPAGSYDVFICKLSGSGSFTWAKQIGAAGYDNGNFITLNPAVSEDLYLTGSFSGMVDFDPGAGVFNLNAAGSNDIFICKLDSAGDFIWATAAGGGAGDMSRCIAFEPSGYLYATGYFFSPSASFGTNVLTNADGSGNSYDIFIAKLDTSIIISGNNEREFNSSVLISPSPFTTQATISFSKEVLNATFSLYNLLGEKVAEVSGIAGESFQFNRGNLSNGVYVFEVREGKSIWRGKAVVY